MNGAVQSILSSLQQAGDGVRGARGGRRILIAFGSGALSALSFAPFGLFPFLLVALAVLVLLVDGAQAAKRPVLSAAWAGWWWGFGQFLAGLYWVAYAFLVDAADHAWQIPIVEVVLPGGLALFMALAAGVSARFWSRDAARVFVLAAAYGATEWLRGHVLTGFPWNLPAYGWGALPGVLQVTALIGSYGLTLLTVLLGASWALLADRDRRHWRLPAAMTLLFAAFWLGGSLRLLLVHPGDVPGIHLRLVQPDIAQRDKYKLRLRLANWRTLVDLSEAPAAETPNVIVWPEAAPPFLLTRVPGAMEEIAYLTGGRRILMMGAVRGYFAGDDDVHYSNSFYIFGRDGGIAAIYDKFHLVPLGEYTPLAPLLERLGIDKLVELPGSFTPGDGPHTYTVPGIPPVGPLICYEVLFPGAVVAAQRPAWIVNVTDDSWFGPSTGPYQHLLIARVRAIEEGLPIVRDANTGITAVIDPLGRIRRELGLGARGFLDSGLPQAVPNTPFARLGDAGFALMLLVLVWGAFSSRRRA